jgi:predicted O-methyltransferase YrrM
METLINEIQGLAGVQRANTFTRVARAACLLNAQNIVETGVYRGIHFDGQSTLIWAKIAEHTGGHVTGIDISPDSIARAGVLLGRYRRFVTLMLRDSLEALEEIRGPIDVLYLDSYDHDPDNPDPCQRHQLAEARIAIPKMAEKSIILLDDCIFSTGGKAKLSDPYIQEAGYTLVALEYQNIYQRGCDNLF